MPEDLDESLRQAMRFAAAQLHPARPTETARADLVAGVALRRKRRQRRAMESLAVIAVLACAGAITVPKLTEHSASRNLQAASSQKAASQKNTFQKSVPSTTAAHSQSGSAAKPSALTPTNTNLSANRGLDPAPNSTASPVTKPVVVTNADTGKTIHLLVGQSLEIKLVGSVSLAWSTPTSSNTKVLSRKSGSASPSSSGGADATFQVIGPGQTTISATQSSACPQTKTACTTPTHRFTITAKAST